MTLIKHITRTEQRDAWRFIWQAIPADRVPHQVWCGVELDRHQFFIHLALRHNLLTYHHDLS